MKSASIRKLYSLHSWVGLTTGVLMFVIAFTGAISVFARPELKIWGNPEIRGELPVAAQQIEQLVVKYAQQVPEAYLEEVMVFLPGVRGFTDLTVVFEAHSGAADADTDSTERGPARGKLYQFDAKSLTLIGEAEGNIRELFEARETDVADFISHFHADLLLGRPVGLLITGLLGLTLMASIVTGLVIHRRILRQLFTFRPGKTFSLSLNDGHKVAGIWGLLFHATIGFTGAFLGLALVILVPAAAFVSFEGDQEKLIEAFTSMPEPVLQQVAAPTQLAGIIEYAGQLNPEAVVSSVTIRGYGDQAAMAYVNIQGGGQMATQTAVYKGADASLQQQFSFYSRHEGVTGEILDLMNPLHFGNFGGVLVKLIWTLLGLSTALLPLTGMMLWVERGVNSNNPRYSAATYRRFNKLIIGGCGGLVLACAMLFPAQLLLKQMGWVADIGSAIGWVFFPLWACALLWSGVSKRPEQSARQLLWLSAYLLMLVLPLDLLFNASQLLELVKQGHLVSLSVDLVLLSLGAWLLRSLRQASSFRPASQPTPATTALNKETI